jgi:hypothetical protein
MLASEGRGSVMSPGIQWGDWIAPEWLAALSQGVQAPRAAYEGADMDPRDALNVALNAMGGGMLTGRGASGAGMNVFHGTQRTKKWYDNPALMKLMERGDDIPAALVEPTYLDALKRSPGGLKMMDGLGPHVGTAEAATQRLSSYYGIPPSKAWKKPDPRLEGAHVLKFEMKPKQPLTKRDGNPMTEGELQARLARIAKSLGFEDADVRRYSAHSGYGKLPAAQTAVRKYLQEQGYDAIPYINAHEGRGSVSWVVLDESLLKNWWDR